jgi:hypothetical protein
MYKKGDLIHYKEEDWYESLLKVITDERNDQCTIRTFACDSDEHTNMGEERIYKTIIGQWTKVRVQDLALYTHWPVHTKEFWDLLNET